MPKFAIAYFLVSFLLISCTQPENKSLQLMYNPKLNMLKIGFPKHWTDISNENPDGPPTYINNLYEDPGVLQISFAEYINGVKPNPDYADLIELSKTVGLKQEFGTLQNTGSGNCSFGKYGFAQFSNTKFPYILVWHLSDSQNFIFATFICSTMPYGEEISDVMLILKSIKKAK